MRNSYIDKQNIFKRRKTNNTFAAKPTAFIVLPCYNEEENIENLIKSIEKNCSTIPYRIIAVDDGSKDSTGKILTQLQKDFPLTVLKHPQNMGLQAALKSGLTQVIRMAKPLDIIITMDSDSTHDPKYIPLILSKLDKDYDVVIASRFVKSAKQKGVSFHRRILSKGISYIGKLLFKFPAKDVTSGYRGYRVNVIAKIMEKYEPNFIESKGFEVSFELLAKAQKVGARIAETPFLLDYSRKKGSSKLKIGKTTYNYLRLMHKLYVNK